MLLGYGLLGCLGMWVVGLCGGVVGQQCCWGTGCSGVWGCRCLVCVVVWWWTTVLLGYGLLGCLGMQVLGLCGGVVGQECCWGIGRSGAGIVETPTLDRGGVNVEMLQGPDHAVGHEIVDCAGASVERRYRREDHSSALGGLLTQP